MKNVKIVMVGGGSYNWCPKLLSDLIQTDDMNGSEVVLLDLNLKAAEDIKAVGEYISKKLKKNFKFIATKNEDTAFRNADFVIITISTGGLDMMRHDLEIPDNYGIYQTVSDSVGPGGWSRLLRNVPVFMKMAKKIEKLSPKAVVLNYTNPMAGLTGAIAQTTSLKTVGLCHGVVGTRHYLAKIFDADPDNMALRFGGVNHFFWIFDFKAKGVDGYETLKKKLAGGTLRKFDKASKDASGFSENNHLLFSEIYENYGYLTYSADRHSCEFFPGYLHDLKLMKSLKLERTSIADRAKGLEKSRSMAKSIAAGKEKIQPLSCETAVDIMKAFITNKPFIDVVNLPNVGQIDNLSRGAVVETLGQINSLGFMPIAIGTIPEPVRSILETHCNVQKMTLEAALTGNKKLAFEALLLDPLCSNLPAAQVRRMGEELMAATKAYLPQFK